MPIALMAPPPGERMRSPAKRSSPGPGTDSSPMNVRSMNAVAVTTTSTLIAKRSASSGSRLR